MPLKGCIFNQSATFPKKPYQFFLNVKVCFDQTKPTHGFGDLPKLSAKDIDIIKELFS
jgi:hypothetical protein